jgi:hypothetical protein
VEYKPLSPFTMGYRLGSRIYVGELVWGVNRTGVVNDTRVIEPNPDGAEVIPGFCPPIIDFELFERVQRLRRARGEQVKRSRAAATPGPEPKLIAPQGRGLTLKYLLTGLLRCPCQASLRPVPSGRRSKEGRRYAYYTCPRHYDGACTNARHFPEDQLREAVIHRLRARLFPAPEQAGQAPPWLPELMELVRQELGRRRGDEPARAAAAQEELQQLEQQIAGWTLSLGNPQLPVAVRGEIEGRFAQAKRRQQDLEQALNAERALQRHLERALDPAEVIDQLRRLDEVLAGYNPTLTNLELSKHIDAIVCHPDGRVELRGTRLGLFEGAVELLSRDGGAAGSAPTTTGGFRPVKPRRRGRLRVPTLSADHNDALGAPDTGLDPGRFAGLPEAFFWTESFVMPQRVCWAKEHAEEVYHAKVSTGLSFEKLVGRFGKSRPTLQHAWNIAVGQRRSGAPRPGPAPATEGEAP